MPLPASPASGGRNLPAITFPVYSVAQEGLVGQLTNAFSLAGLEKGVLGAASNPYTYWVVQNNAATIEKLESKNLPFFKTQAEATAYANQLNAHGGKPDQGAGNVSYADLNSLTGANPSVTNQAPGTETGGILSGWSLEVSGLKDWFFRALMLGGGAFLMVLGVSKLTGAGNKVTEIASKVPVIPV